jgi:6-phosphofructokinase 2
LRTTHEYYNPGGGGINLARVFVRMGGNARCVYLSGGATGAALDGLLDLHQLVRSPIAIRGDTRIAMTALEHETGKEYRFTPAGPHVAEAEWRACLATLAEIECDWLVASGSLPPGVPEDFYARVSEIVRGRGIPMALDSSGKALRAGFGSTGVRLAKPSRGELAELAGRPLGTIEEVGAAALELVRAGRAETVAATLGHEGAVLASADLLLHAPALPIQAASAVGAGDSFLAGMIHGLSTGKRLEEAFRIGVAAGSAAVLRPGTDLARPDDIGRLLPAVRTKALSLGRSG